MSDSGSFDVRPMVRDDIPAYLEFAASSYGPHAYQAQARYLRWLYETDGSGVGYADAKLAVDGEKVVGCIHKMRYRVKAGADLVQVACPHNLFVAESHRRGAGVALIMESFKDERHIFLMGVTPPVTEIYERLRCKRIDSYWHRALLNPFSALAVYPVRRFAPSASNHLARALRAAACRLSFDSELRVSTEVSNERAHFIAEALRPREREVVGVDWDDTSVMHRFFSPSGPQHLLFELEPAGSSSPSAFAIVSVGFRRNLLVARIVESFAEDEQGASRLFKSVRRTMSLAGANVLLAYTTALHKSRCLAASGVPALAEPPISYLRHRGAPGEWPALRFDGGIGDLGFEAITPDA